ncbi:MAG: bZIP transcription factor, partial [Bacteroidetes bacterium]
GTGAGLDDLVTFTASGRVGIGTTAPDQLLTLSHTSNPVLRLDRSAAGEFDMELSLQDDGSLFFRGGADDVGSNLTDLMVLSSEGKLAVGTTQFPTTIGGTDISAYSLFAAGGVLTEEVRVRTGWADYVFDPDYRLPALTEVDAYIRRFGRLPGMPSAEEVESQGLELGDIAVRQQEKIEELFLHLIDMQKQLEALQAENAELKARLQALER